MDLNALINLQRGPLTDVVAWLQCQQLLANPLLCSQCNNRVMEMKQRNGNHVDGFFCYVCYTSFPLFLKKTLLNHYQFMKKHFPIFIDQTRVLLAFFLGG